MLLSPACLAGLARLGRWTPVMVRIALRDLARYRARSGPALAAISLSVLIAAIVSVVGAARFGGAVDYVGPAGQFPVAWLLWILVGMPLIAAAASWLLAGREPPVIARQPLE